MAAPTVKIQLFGHSFVRRLRDFISRSETDSFTWDLKGPPLIQYSGFPGASVDGLHSHLEDVSDFDPDIVFILIGTVDLYCASASPTTVADNLMQLVGKCLDIGVKKVVVLSITHRCEPTIPTRFPVNMDWFNTRVDETNCLISDLLRHTPKTYFWKLKGFWSESAKAKIFAPDGCHLSSKGQTKLIYNLRAATVAILRQSIWCLASYTLVGWLVLHTISYVYFCSYYFLLKYGCTRLDIVHLWLIPVILTVLTFYWHSALCISSNNFNLLSGPTTWRPLLFWLNTVTVLQICMHFGVTPCSDTPVWHIFHSALCFTLMPVWGQGTLCSNDAAPCVILHYFVLLRTVGLYFCTAPCTNTAPCVFKTVLPTYNAPHVPMTRRPVSLFTVWFYPRLLVFIPYSALY